MAEKKRSLNQQQRQAPLEKRLLQKREWIRNLSFPAQHKASTSLA